MLESTRKLLLDTAIEFDRAVTLGRETCVTLRDGVPCERCYRRALNQIRTAAQPQPDNSSVGSQEYLQPKPKPRQRTA
ncbi:hypothetical protein [Leptolyngbya sp. FACHB-17]|uniref:hypothetical protein n=1 Tax=unclassified Leptolyngbya TaxID=2650499 RepID=UPI00168038CF|nr:hypothetical protein [Leptolyngbya sp. FACHB-17]MBD2079743.1 hypothetical protein [Leptolyngbya sp. FACHB-17]